MSLIKSKTFGIQIQFKYYFKSADSKDSINNQENKIIIDSVETEAKDHRVEEVTAANKEEEEDADDDEDDDEENTCLFQLFFQKLNKYFSEIIYNIESNEYRMEHYESSSLSSAVSNKASAATASTLHNESIITTIVAGNEKEEVDYKLEKETSSKVAEKKLPMSRSESDIFSELQSQTNPTDADEKKQNNQTTPASNSTSAGPANNQAWVIIHTS